MAGSRADIATARLVLRPLQSRDAPALHAFFSDPVAMEYWEAPYTDLAQTEAWVAGTLAGSPDEVCEYVLVENGDVIGKAGLWKAPELGYFLRWDRWGHGLMAEALTTLIPVLHREMAQPILTAEVTPENTASLNVLHKVGFHEVRRGVQDHWDGTKWCDTAYLQRASEDPVAPGG
ncbi:MAG: GNAT family N-acetyltransferase [Pseudomonadota bacterium]